MWTATAPAVLTSATVTFTPARSGYSQDLTVIAMQGTDGVGASVTASGTSGAVRQPHYHQGQLAGVRGGQRLGPVGGADPAGRWTMLDQWVATGNGDTYWSQYTSQRTGAAWTAVVNAGDTAPTNDQWNLVAIELLGDD